MKQLSKQSIQLAFLALSIGAAGCVGQLPGESDPVSDPAPDPDSDEPPDPGPEPAPQALLLSGQVLSYFPSMLGTPDPIAADLATEGLAPALSAASLADGYYVFENVPAASVFYVNVTLPANFRPTRNEPITVVDQTIEAPVYAVSNVGALRQYTSAGNIVEAPNTALVVIDLLRNNGTPLEGIAPEAITLIDSLAQPVLLDPATQGPYFVGSAGDAVSIAQQPTSVAVLGKSRAVLLNLPPGSYTLNVAYENGMGELTEAITPLVMLAGGATLAKSGGMGGGGPGPNPNPTFTNDIYPLLQKASAGGDACANCHTAGGLGNVLPFDAPSVAGVHAAILARPGVVDLAAPADSLLLTKPLYEDPPNHPNATYPSVDYPSYVTILTWIAQGAVL